MVEDWFGRPAAPVCGLSSHGLYFRAWIDWSQVPPGVDPSDPSTMEQYVALLSDVDYPESLQEDATTAITEFEFLLITAERAGGGANGFRQAMQRPEVSASIDRAFRALVPIEQRAQTCEEYAPYVEPL